MRINRRHGNTQARRRLGFATDKVIEMFDPPSHAPVSRAAFRALAREEILAAARTLNHAVTARDAEALARGIDYKSAGDVRRAIRDAARWLKRQVGDTPYALLTSDLGPLSWKNTKFKSDEWLAPRVVEAMRRWPSLVVPEAKLDDKLVRRRLKLKGVAAFVHLDDATYSGTQLGGMMATFNDKAPPGSMLYVATGFATKKAREKLRGIGGRTKFYAPPGDLRSVGNFLGTVKDASAKARLTNFLKTKNRVNGGRYSDPKLLDLSLAVLAHKVPNGISVPVIIGQYGLAKHMARPPYARRKMNSAVLYGNTYSHNGVLYVSSFDPESGGWDHFGYRLVGGKARETVTFTSRHPGKRALAQHLARGSVE